MPWPFSESIKKRACRYLLQRYLGHFLQEKLSLEQLSLDLYQGTGSLAQVPLDKWCLNEILESADAPLEVTEGFIQSISLSVPWGSLLQENCALEVKGLEMVFRPRPRLATGSEPMYWSSFMTSSMQLAKECLSQKLTDEQGEASQPFEGLEKFAETIETENSSKIGLANKDRKNRPMQQEEEYRIQMELNRYYLRKDSLSAGVSSEQSFYETESARTPSSRALPSRSVSVDESRPELIFRLAVGTFSISVLHIDPLSPPETSLNLNPLTPLAIAFFTCIEKIDPARFSTDDFKSFRAVFAEACKHDHLRFIGTGIKVSYEQRQRSASRYFSTDMSIGQMELLECLFPTDSHSVPPHYTELLMFHSKERTDSHPPVCLQLHYKHSENKGPQGNQARLSSVPQKAELQIKLNPVFCELDISIVDRLNSLLQPQKLTTVEMMASHMYTSYNKHTSLHKAFTEVFLDDSHSPANCRVSVQVATPALNLSVRFPIPDLRSDQERGPWFKKSLQKEILHLAFTDLEFKTEFIGGSTPEQIKLELTFRELVAVHSILERIAAEEEESDGRYQEEEEGGAHSLKDVCDLRRPAPSPFSSRRVMFENEQMVMPGDPVEMTEFQDKAISNSHYVLELTLPSIHVTLPNKSFYEKLYNRIFNDLLLWEPTAPSPVETFENISYGIGLSVASQLINTFNKDSFSPFKSTVHYDEESGSEEETLQYFSTVDPNYRSRRKKKLDSQNKNSQSFLSVLLSINHGLMAVFTDVRQDNGELLENKHGEFWLEFSSGSLFCVTKYEGCDDKHYICLHSSSLSLYHKGVVDGVILPTETRLPSSTRPHWLEPTIYSSEEDGLSRASSDGVAGDTLNMLSVAVKILSDKSESNTKTEPRFELHCSSDTVHIRTCSDSCAALMNLIQYIASYGDLHAANKVETKPGASHRKMKMLRDLMSDAMEEVDLQQAAASAQAQANGVLDEKSQTQEPCCSDLFLFPDESGNMSQEPGPPYPSFTHHLISDAMAGVPTENDDFCILFAPRANIQVKFQHEVYPPCKPECDSGLLEHPVSRQVFVVQDLEIRDRLATSQMNKFLYLYCSKEMPRKAHSNMLTVKVLHVRPESGRSPQECCLRVSLMPLRLNIDQDALFFLKDFFTSLSTEVELLMAPDPEVKKSPGADVTCSLPRHLSTSKEPNLVLSFPGPKQPSQDGGANSVEVVNGEEEKDFSAEEASFSDQPVFFREFRFTSEVPIRLDYHGKHVSMDQGTLAGILIGLAQLNCSELKLKRLFYRHGLLGVDKLFSYAITEWLTDIKKNQLPGILGGVGPMHSLVQLVQGLKDLVWLPIEQYRKDGRIVRGFQRGAASFGTSTAMAALELTNRTVQTIQAAAETAYDMVSPGTLSSEPKKIKRFPHHRLAHQPVDLREGVAKAYSVVKEGLTDTAQTIYETAAREHESRGVTGAVGEVLRQIPPAVVKPLIVATEATSNVLGGMRNQIRPDVRQDESQKWRHGED
ncbi:hypothetical protein GH733_002122 [Mirounga leonina]|nr:hypothetical protein GH733_002122 [Mirounga leonina]